jgi:hypothetical protein
MIWDVRIREQCGTRVAASPPLAAKIPIPDGNCQDALGTAMLLLGRGAHP